MGNIAEKIQKPLMRVIHFFFQQYSRNQVMKKASRCLNVASFIAEFLL